MSNRANLHKYQSSSSELYLRSLLTGSQKKKKNEKQGDNSIKYRWEKNSGCALTAIFIPTLVWHRLLLAELRTVSKHKATALHTEHTAPQTLPCPFCSNTPATGSNSLLLMSEKRAVWCRRFLKPQSYIKSICWYFNGLRRNQRASKVLRVKEAQQSLRQNRNTLHKYRGGNVTSLQCIERSLEAG